MRVCIGQIRATASENTHVQSRYVAVTAELEETKRNLQKAVEEGNFMANCIKYLREELEQTKSEIQHLKARDQPVDYNNEPIDPEIEHLKFIEKGTKLVEVKTQNTSGTDHDGIMELQKRRYVTFASSPALTRVLTSKDDGDVIEKPPPKMKKKPLNPLLGWLFSKKKDTQDGESPRAYGPR